MFMPERNSSFAFICGATACTSVSAEAMLVDAMVSGSLSAKDAVSAVLADENNSYSKNELKAAALNLKRLFGG